MLSAVMKIAENSNNYPWGLIREEGLFGSGGLIDHLSLVSIRSLPVATSLYLSLNF